MVTRKTFIALVSILLCGWNSAVFAQYPSLLWEISGNGLKKPSYLYGTIHSGDERVFAFGDSAKKAWKHTEVVVGELYLSDDSTRKMAKYVLLPQGKELSDYISEKDYKTVMKYAKKHMGSSYTVINKMKPIYSSYYLAKETSSQKKIYPQRQYTLDEYLQLLAKEEEKTVLGLETYEEQLSALDKIPMEEQIASLMSTVSSTKKSDHTLEDMIGIYQTQNLDSLMVFIATNPEYSDNFSENLIVIRNYRMADRIVPIIVDKPAFIAVGTAHLPGKEGVIELLRQKGFTVRPVYSPLHKVERIK